MARGISERLPPLIRVVLTESLDLGSEFQRDGYNINWRAHDDQLLLSKIVARSPGSRRGH